MTTTINLTSPRSKRLDRSDWRRSRLRRIYRRWQRAPRHPLAMDRWSEPLAVLGGRQGAFVAFTSSVLLIPFSQAIVPLPAGSKLPAAVTLLPFHPRALLALAILYLANACLIDRHLAQRTPREGRVRPWLRWLRFAASGLPLLGSFAILGWRWILDREPRWALREAVPLPPVPGSLQTPAAGILRRLAIASHLRRLADLVVRRLTTDVGIGFLELGNAVVLGFAIYSRTSDDPELRQKLVVAALGIVFHLVAFGGMLLHLWVEARRAEISGWNLRLYLSLSLCWLVPVPYLAVAGLFGIWIQWLLSDSAPREKTLVHEAYSRRRDHYLPLGWTLEETVRRWWQGASWRERLSQPAATLAPAVEPTYARDRLFWLYRIKSIVLAFDAMALSWIVLWLADRHVGCRPVVDRTLDWVVNGSGVLCLLAVLVMAAYFVALALRVGGPLDVLDRHPYAQYLAITQFSWLAGLAAGSDLLERDAQALAQTLQSVGVLGCAATFLAFLLRVFLPGGERIKGPYHGLLGLMGFLAVGLAGQSATADETYARALMSWVMALAITAPLWHVLIARFLLGWLLRPFEVRDLTSEELPDGVHRSLWLLTATSVLPLGGLAIPLWIYLRHRKWPSSWFRVGM